MGTKDEKRLSGTDPKPEGSIDTGNKSNGGTAGNTSSTTAGAGTSGTGSSGGSGAGKTEEKKVPQSGLLDVAEAPPAPEAPKKKQIKKKKPAKKKPDTAPALSSDQISSLIVSISTVIATRENLSMFALSEMEAEQIATPLANMIAKSEKLSAVNEHADAIALVSACLIIMLPRFIMYFDVIKQKKLQANGGVKIVDSRNKETKSTASDRGADRAPATKQPINGDGISSAIPSIV